MHRACKAEIRTLIGQYKLELDEHLAFALPSRLKRPEAGFVK
jgi:hypothetical protein